MNTLISSRRQNLPDFLVQSATNRSITQILIFTIFDKLKAQSVPLAFNQPTSQPTTT
jgi:hypothetical protein